MPNAYSDVFANAKEGNTRSSENDVSSQGTIIIYQGELLLDADTHSFDMQTHRRIMCTEMQSFA